MEKEDSENIWFFYKTWIGWLLFIQQAFTAALYTKVLSTVSPEICPSTETLNADLIDSTTDFPRRKISK